MILVDVRLPQMDGIEVTRRLSQEHPDVGVIILTAYDDPAYAPQAVRAGAKAFVLKKAEGEEVLDTVRMVAHGHTVLEGELEAPPDGGVAPEGAGAAAAPRRTRGTPGPPPVYTLPGYREQVQAREAAERREGPRSQ